MKIKFLVLLPLFFLLTGCYNYSELNEMSIVSGISIDKDDDLYNISFLITNAQKPDTSSQDNSTDMTVISGKGKSITEAINRIDLKNPKKYYLGHLSSLIVSKEIAYDMHDVVDFFIRNPQSLKKFYLVVSDGKAEDVLKVISPQEVLPSENIISNLKEINEEQAIISSQKYSEFLLNILADGKNPVLPVVKVVGNVKNADDTKDLEKIDVKTNVEIKSLGLFKDYKLIKIANKEESRAINVINNKANDLYLDIDCGDGKSVAVINNIKTKVSYKIKGDIPSYKIKVSGDIKLHETTCGYNLDNDEVRKKIEKEFEKRLKKIVMSGISLAQNEKIDIFGLGNMLYKNDYDYWKLHKASWDNIFSKLKIDVETDLALVSVGAARNTMEGLDNE